jgi:hypothetical protein
MCSSILITAISRDGELEAVAGVEDIDLTSLTPVALIKGEDEEETLQLRNLYSEAEKYLRKFKWCKNVLEAYLGYGVADVFGLFFFHIDPIKNEDDYLWVIVRDIPSAYLVTDEARNCADALRIYIKLFREWVAAIRENRSVATLIPANVPPTRANAALLESRLNFLEENILPQMAN